MRGVVTMLSVVVYCDGSRPFGVAVSSVSLIFKSPSFMSLITGLALTSRHLTISTATAIFLLPSYI